MALQRRTPLSVPSSGSAQLRHSVRFAMHLPIGNGAAINGPHSLDGFAIICEAKGLGAKRIRHRRIVLGRSLSPSTARTGLMDDSVSGLSPMMTARRADGRGHSSEANRCGTVWEGHVPGCQWTRLRDASTRMMGMGSDDAWHHRPFVRNPWKGPPASAEGPFRTGNRERSRS